MAETLTETAGRSRPGVLRRVWQIALLLLGLIVAYYVIGGFIVNRIEADPNFGANLEVPAGASHSVAVAAALIRREVDEHYWTPNDPFFLPGSVLDNTPNFQSGIIGALSRFGIELADQIARVRGSSQIDPDLDQAAGRLRYPPNIWLFDFPNSLAPTTSSERSFREAADALERYNQRLAAGQATFERRADNLLATLDRFAADLGSMGAAIDNHFATGSLFAFNADDIFYANKGRMYAYFLLMRGLGQDFDALIAERRLEAAWAQTVDSFLAAVELQPWIVLDGAPDSQFVPSHLSGQGFFIMRARIQLRELSQILQS